MAAHDALSLPLARPGTIAWLRKQCRFSLATLIEWLLGYSLAFTAAWARADHLMLAGAMAAALLAGAVYRMLVRSERNRIVYLLALTLAAGAGVIIGAVVLQHARLAQLDRLIEEDEAAQRRLVKLAEQSATRLALAEVKKLLPSEQQANAAALLRVQRMLGVISARDWQMESIAKSRSLCPPPLPQTPDDWTPLALPMEERFATPITIKMDSAAFSDFMEVIEQETGLHCEFEGSPAAASPITVDFIRCDLDWIDNTLFVAAGISCEVDRAHGRLVFKKKE